MAIQEDGWVDFSTLKSELGLTDGNLGAHIQKLEDANYVKVKKKFVGKRPKTLLQGPTKVAQHLQRIEKRYGRFLANDRFIHKWG